MYEDIFIKVFFILGVAVWVVVFLNTKQKDKSKVENTLSDNFVVNKSLKLPRKDFSEVSHCEYTSRLDEKGDARITMTEENAELLKSNLLGSIKPEIKQRQFAEIQNLLDKRETVARECTVKVELPSWVRDKYDSLGIAEKSIISEVKKQFEQDYQYMLNRFCALTTARELDLNASGRALAILKSETSILEGIRDFKHHINRLDLCFDIEDWTNQARKIKDNVEREIEDYLDNWGCRENMANAWIKFQDQGN